MAVKKKKKSGKAIPKYAPDQLSKFAHENPEAFSKSLAKIWKNSPELAKQALVGRGLIPGVTMGGVPNSMLVGGGEQQVQQSLEALNLAQQMELGRQGLAQGLLTEMRDMQRDPFSIVPALQTYGAAGGGTLAPVSALAGTGGTGWESPYGAAANRIMDSLVRFATGQGGSEAPLPMTMNQAVAEKAKTDPALAAQIAANMKKKSQTKKAPAGGKGGKPSTKLPKKPFDWGAYITANPGVLTATPERTSMLSQYLASQTPPADMTKFNPTTGAAVR